MMSDNLKTYRLDKIADWQLSNSPAQEVSLPDIQRGFVWKVYQIEALWDSLLRGYPIGSFLLSKGDQGNLLLLDGQQRATAVMLGYYNPWIYHNQDKLKEEKKLWSLKKVPTVWIDLLNNANKPVSYKYIIRVLTQSHPWGYQRNSNHEVLRVNDRRGALAEFKKNNENQLGYTKFLLTQVFPYDAYLPVPLSFLIESSCEDIGNWKEKLISLCEHYLSFNIRTKYINEPDFNYLDKLKNIDVNDKYIKDLHYSIRRLDDVVVPGIIVDHEVLLEDDERSTDDPTLFIRLNLFGTKISSEEIIYSAYKAAFKESKNLVEMIGKDFLAPSTVITLIARLANAELNGNYPYPINIKDFQRRIKEVEYREKLQYLIGDEQHSIAKELFDKTVHLLKFCGPTLVTPDVLIKKIIKEQQDLFLMLLQWLRINDEKLIDAEENKRILAAITSLAWFGRDNRRYVREIWNDIKEPNFWSQQILKIPFFGKHDPVMYPLLDPNILREFLLEKVANELVTWDILYPVANSSIYSSYRKILDYYIKLTNEDGPDHVTNTINWIWDTFINRLDSSKSMLLFVQRDYINKNFYDFNQLEDLEDTNTPWDWDHIYPSSWVYGQWNMHPITKRWNNSIGNLRALSFEVNRSESNIFPPKERISSEDDKEESFIKNNDWNYWQMLDSEFKREETEKVKIHARAVIERLVNIYEEWYKTLSIGDLFNFDEDNSAVN
jgi:hypothetical protein